MARTTEAVMQTLGALAETIEQAPSSTIEPVVGADTAGRQALEVLRKLRGAEFERLRPGVTLGQGGMGIVKLAEQVALGRDVAVKSLRPEFTTDAAILSLLREAWVTGSLEHPNIVPIHDVSLDALGRPEVVLKRIEGEHWGDLMHDAALVKERHGADNLLEWNLRIFRQVTRAVHFAHSRGIIHRDLKPENVMIGSFGEVYLVDWGIAVSVKDDPSGRIRLAKDATEMAGTPCYMAPEMLGGVESQLSTLTDVYLLGGILFEISEGRPPHSGSHLAEIVSSILTTPPETQHASEELSQILSRAMHAKPSARYESAEQLGLALDDYLRHRGSRCLEARAEESLRELRLLIEAQGAECREEERLYALYAECRFGFREALAAWPENAGAQEGSREATELMIELELSHGDGEAAERLLVDLSAPSPNLLERIARTRQEAAAKRARFAALDADLDMSTGQRTRALLAAALGVIWTVMPLVKDLFPPVTVYGWVGIGSSIGLLSLVLGFGYWARDSLSRTLPNRRIFAALIFTFVANMVLGAGCYMLDVPPLVYHTLLLFSWAAVASVLAITVDIHLWPAAAGFLLGFLLAAHNPAHVHWYMSVSNLVLTLNAVYVWRPAEGYFPKRTR
ncbi:MAG: serine/threonine protein kinase [Deltaproteobacteria bacterium]|nr:serine/threonine protein kinase [Deltaproteobacteria bacterium]